MSRLRRPGIQAQLIGIVLLVVLPLAGVGAWLASSARRSAETLLRDRLQRVLAGVTRTVGDRWVERRSELLTLGETWSRTDGARASPDVSPELRRLWEGLRFVASRAELRLDGASTPRQLTRATRTQAASGGTGSTLPVEVAVYGRGASGRVGTLRTWLRAAALYPGGLEGGGVGGSVLAMFDGRGRPVVRPAMMPSEGFLEDRFRWKGETWLVARRTLAEPPVQVAVAAPLEPAVAPFRRAARRGSVALLLVLAAALGTGGFLARRTARPLVELAGAARSVSGGHVKDEVEVSESGPREVVDLARAFNSMAASLRRTLRRLSQREAAAAVGEFAASVAHEVRNPLTSLQLDLQRALRRLEAGEPCRGLVERSLEQARRLELSVQDTLTLARTGRLELAPLDLRDPVERAVRTIMASAQAGKVRIEVDVPDRRVTVDGNEEALERLFLNLLLNAAEATGAGGSVRVRLVPGESVFDVVVEDDGPGIPLERRGAVLEPFQSNRGAGTGLGLSVAERIALAHGGGLTIGDSSLGGASVRVSLPAYEPPTSGRV